MLGKRPSRITMSLGLGTGSAATLALAIQLVGATALAQEAARPSLEEIIVTATRQVDTVNRVPLTITAVTQDHVDQQGIKNAADLARFVPGLNVVGNLGGAQQTFNIRGIVGTTGAATTGVYLDDTNLSKRANGGVAQNNGVVLPLLYDLERVEVLKGPQGTLYGGSSEGGTVRYITPTPSLTEYSGSTRAEVSSMGSRSELSHEFAAAFGGPIIEDKVGFRVSGIRRETGGWIDVVSAYTGQMIREDANSTVEWAGRASLLWQITDSVSAQLSGYHVDNEDEGGPGSSTAIFVNGQQAPNATFTTQARCITNNQRTLALAQPGETAARSFIPTNGACTTANGTAAYVREGNTYGPFVTGRDVSLATGRQAIVGSASEADVAALSLNFDLGSVNLKSVTSYLSDKGTSAGAGGEEWSSATPGAGQFLTDAAGNADTTHRGFPLFQQFFDATGEGFSGFFDARNERDGYEQEFRLSSNADSRLTWVAGAYFSDTDTNILYRYLNSADRADLVMRLMYGDDMGGPDGNVSPSAARYGVVNDQGFQTRLQADISEQESAIFAEANYWLLPERLKAILGLRYSKVELDYTQLNFGQFSGRLPTSEGSLTTGKSSDEPVTPKVGLEYQFTDTRRVYATASKGFRAGGVSSQISQTICQTALDGLGITAADIPPAFDPDTVWSYELGSKLRLLDGTLQLNVAAFRIDWDDIQATTVLSCGQGFTSNGGQARSEGGEIQLQYRPLNDLNLYLNASYTDAYYVDPVTGPSGPNATAPPRPSFNAGDKFDIPPLQLSAGAQFNFTLAQRWESYVRLDGTYQNSYVAGATFGSSGYGTNYFTRNNPSRQQLNLRTGVNFGNGLDVNLFVQNLLDEDKLIAGFGDGRGQCSSVVDNGSDCSVYTSYNPFVNQTFQTPRRIGLQATYKFGN